MKTIFVLCASLFSANFAAAYILPTRIILQKTSENAGRGVYSVEQEVQFQSGSDILSLKENWLIENEHTLRVTVTGPKELPAPVRMQYLYANGQRYEFNGSARVARKMPPDFFEKFLNFRTAESFASALIGLKLIPTSAMNKRVIRSGNEFKYEEEPFVRYARVGGVAAYAFGEPAAPDKELSPPGLWIEQDQFVVRKVRLPDQAEMTADNYSQFAKGLSYPRQRTIRWGNHVVTIRLIGISSRTGNTKTLFQTSSLDISPRLEGLNNHPAKDAVLEFYSRFR